MNKQKRIYASVALLAATALPQQSIAQLLLEEVVVTAQKREQSLQDVPISVSAVSGDRIKDLNVQSAQGLADYVPNFTIIKDPVGDKINIRGIQSGNLASFEQSVATYVDGLYRGRGVQARFSFLDVGLVEVLRGPQGTLFGKNTVGGALNITSALPTDEFSGEIAASYNIDFEEPALNGYVSAPIGDNIQARFAFQGRELRKGWVNNDMYDADSPEIDDKAGRLYVTWDASDNTMITFKVEAGDWDVQGQPWDLITAGIVPGLQGNRDYNTSMGNNVSYVTNVLGFPAAVAGNVEPVDFGNAASFEGDSQELLLKAEHQLHNGGTLTAIAGFSSYEFERKLDADFNPLPGLRFDDTEDFEQTSIELRFSSDTGGTLEYIAGLYYQKDKLKVDGLGLFNGIFLNNFLGLGCSSGGGTAVNGDAEATLAANFGNTDAQTTFSCVNTALLAPLIDAGFEGTNRYHFLEQDTDSYAAFGQLTWHINEAVAATVGLRYTYEEKEAVQGANAAEYRAGSTAPTTNPLLLLPAQIIGEFTPHLFDDLQRDAEVVTWSTNLQWRVTEDTMLYASASSGFKGGGYNSFFLGESGGLGADPDDAEFVREEALAFELGAKLVLLNGAADLNIAAFRTEFDDLQVSLFTGSTSFIVQNAAQAVTQGIEIDARWLATEDLLFTAALAWLDFEYEDFVNQACTSEQFVDFRENAFQTNPAAALFNNQECARAGVNDLSGQTSENSPEYQASVIAEYTLPLGGYELVTVGAVSYQDKQFRQADLDPVLEDDAFIKLDLTLKFGPQEGNWDIALIARNLGDVTTISYGNDAPLFTGTRQIALDQPRNVMLRGRVTF